MAEFYDGVYLKENSDRTTVDVFIPGLRGTVLEVNISKTSNIDFIYSKNSLFTIKLSNEAISSIENSESRTINGKNHNVTGTARNIPSPNIKSTEVKQIINSFSGIGNILKDEIKKCADNIGEYIANIDLQISTIKKKNGIIDRKFNQQPSEKQIRFISPQEGEEVNYNDEKQKSLSSIILDNDEGVKLQNKEGKGFEVGSKQVSLRGKLSKNQAGDEAPMGVIGFESISNPIVDILPKGNALTPHTSRIPNVLGYINMGIGIFNVVNVIRQLYDIESKWRETDSGFQKIVDEGISLSIIDEDAQREAIEASKYAASSKSNRIKEKVDKVKRLFNTT